MNEITTALSYTQIEVDCDGKQNFYPHSIAYKIIDADNGLNDHALNLFSALTLFWVSFLGVS